MTLQICHQQIDLRFCFVFFRATSVCTIDGMFAVVCVKVALRFVHYISIMYFYYYKGRYVSKNDIAEGYHQTDNIIL